MRLGLFSKQHNNDHNDPEHRQQEHRGSISKFHLNGKIDEATDGQNPEIRLLRNTKMTDHK